MAPKRRKKAGLTRMDAALDQMSSFGFSRPLVRKTVKSLLKVYGDDGWKLIEEDGYKVLLDVILDEQETAQTDNLLKDASSAKVATEDASFSGSDKVSLTDNVESSEVPLLSIKGLENQECCKDSDLDNKAPVNVSTRIRKPCYGWISDDDSDEDTKVLALPPAT